MVFDNYLSQFKTELKIDHKLKSHTRKASSKSKSRDGSTHTDSNGTIAAKKIKHPRKEKALDTFTTFLGIICLTATYLYFRLGYLLVSSPTTTPTTLITPKITPIIDPVVSTTTSNPTTTTSAPLSDGEYFSSIIRMKELARLEQSLIDEMKIVVTNWTETDSVLHGDHWHKGLSKIKSYINDYDSSFTPMLFESSDIEKAVVSHPLICHRTIRRVLFNLPDVLTYNVEGRLENLAKLAALIEPAVTVDDFIGAVDGILRLQNTFLMSPEDFARGRLQNLETKSGLTETDCFLIGFWALNEKKLLSVSIEWIVQALRMFLHREVDESTEMISIEMVREALRDAIEMHNKAVVVKNPLTFGKMVDKNLSEMTQDNEEQLMKTFYNISSPSSYGSVLVTNDEKNFEALCRGDKLRNETFTKNLYCYYKTDYPFLVIKPLKVEIHSYDPLVLQFYDLLPETIINHFINSTSHLLKRALVTTDFIGSKALSKGRIALTHWHDDRSDEMLMAFPQIIHEATSLNTKPRNSTEFSQISTYGTIGGLFGPHHDNIQNNELYDDKVYEDDAISRGDRIATIMFYLSDLKLGGGTAFPRIGLLAQPIKGSAVFWYNLKKNGKRHEETMHGGCPVLLGEKWVVNKWILSGDQMFLRKCTLDSNM